MLDEVASQLVRHPRKSESDMTDCKLVTWHGLQAAEVDKVFPDAIRIGGMAVDFESTEMGIWRFRDGAGNSAFAFDKGEGLVSHGSHILTSKMVNDLKTMGASVRT